MKEAWIANSSRSTGTISLRAFCLRGIISPRRNTMGRYYFDLRDAAGLSADEGRRCFARHPSGKEAARSLSDMARDVHPELDH